MILAIFGAGASYDSVESQGLSDPDADPLEATLVGAEASLDQYRPPLARELFDPRFLDVLGHFPECLALAPILRTDSIERVFSDLFREAETYARRQHQLLAARFYIRAMLWECERQWVARSRGESNYLTLLDELDGLAPGEQISLVTFNYDTLLDRALHAGGRLAPTDLPGFISDTRWRLFKLHGSLSWGHEIQAGYSGSLSGDPGNDARRIVAHGPKAFKLTDDFHYHGFAEQYVVRFPLERSRLVTVIPAIAIPVAQKDLFECPLAHVAKLNELLPQARRLVVVGWRAADVTLLNLLGERLPRGTPFCVVDRSKAEAQAIARVISQATGAVWQADECFGGGFSGVIRNRALRPFLEWTRAK